MLSFIGRWPVLVDNNIWYAGGLLVTNWIATQYGGYKERKSQDRYLLDEIKTLRKEAETARKEAEAVAKDEREKREKAERSIARMVDKIKEMTTAMEELKKKVAELSAQVSDHNELEERYEDLIVENDNLVSELERATKQLIDSEVAREELMDEIAEIRKLYHQGVRAPGGGLAFIPKPPPQKGNANESDEDGYNLDSSGIPR